MPVPNEIRAVPYKRDAALAVWSAALALGWGAIALVAQSHGAAFPRTEVELGGVRLGSWSVVSAYVGMSAVRSVSQMLWSAFLQPYYVPPGVMLGIATFNAVFDGLGLLALLEGGRPPALDAQDVWWMGLFAAGMLLERVPEVQRAVWKSRRENRGKPFMGGLFGVLVHANYTGYTMWRVAMYGMSRVWWAQLANAFLVSQFVPEVRLQHERNAKKYGPEYEAYFQRTWKMFPGVW